MKRIYVSVPEDLLERLDQAAREAGLTRSRLVEKVLRLGLGEPRRRPLLDDPRVRRAWERIQAGKYNWAGPIDVVGEIRRLRETQRAR